MPPKKATATATMKKTQKPPEHASYKDMIKEAILNLKERNGSSRQALKKYVQANNKITAATPQAFDNQFNKALRSGVEKGEFMQPKGPSGPVKLAKKEPAVKKPEAKDKAKVDVVKKAPAAKKAVATTKKAPTKTEKDAAAKKAVPPKKAVSAKPKANTAKPRKAAPKAPAIIEPEKVLTTTKSGRVTKTKTSTTSKKAPTTKKVSVKRVAPKKKVEKLEKAEVVAAAA